MDGEVRHLVGLLLGTEDDWPRAFECLLTGLAPVRDDARRRHVFATERLTIEPFSLRSRPRTDLVIDRLAYWYYHPREWLKKSLMDNVFKPFDLDAVAAQIGYPTYMKPFDGGGWRGVSCVRNAEELRARRASADQPGRRV